jgi:signal transduction histidine kinase
LATVHRIVEGNSGTLHVMSRPGQGSEFRIHLPESTVSPAPEIPE